MTTEERAAALKFYDILQEKVKTYVEGSPKDLFFYHDKNSGSWEDFRRKAVCAFAVMLRKDYTTSQMIAQFLPPRTPRKSIEKHRPNGTLITTLPWDAVTFMYCYVTKEQSHMSVDVCVVSAYEKEYDPYWSTLKTEFDRIIYARQDEDGQFVFKKDGKDLVDCYEQKALEIAEICIKRIASAVTIYQELKRYAKNQQKLLERKKEIDDKYKAEMADLTRTYNVYIDKMRRLVDIQDAGVDFTSEIKDGSVNDRHEEPAT